MVTVKASPSVRGFAHAARTPWTAAALWSAGSRAGELHERSLDPGRNDGCTGTEDGPDLDLRLR